MEDDSPSVGGFARFLARHPSIRPPRARTRAPPQAPPPSHRLVAHTARKSPPTVRTRSRSPYSPLPQRQLRLTCSICSITDTLVDSEADAVPAEINRTEFEPSDDESALSLQVWCSRVYWGWFAASRAVPPLSAVAGQPW